MQSIFHQDTQITSAELLALRATNIEVVAAPPAGLAAVPIAVHMMLDRTSATYVQVAATDALALKYSASTEISELGTEAQMSTFIESGADAMLFVNLDANLVPVAATAIDLDNNGAAEWTTGDGTLSIRVFYALVPVTAFV